MPDGVFSNREIERAQIRAQSCGREPADIVLPTSVCRLFVRIVSPARVEMKSEEVAISTAGCVGYCSEELVEIIDTRSYGAGITRISPSIAVEVRAWCVHHSMQHHFVAIRVNKVFTLHSEWWCVAVLRHDATHKGSESEGKSKKSSHIFQWLIKILIVKQMQNYKIKNRNAKYNVTKIVTFVTIV